MPNKWAQEKFPKTSHFKYSSGMNFRHKWKKVASSEVRLVFNHSKELLKLNSFSSDFELDYFGYREMREGIIGNDFG